MKKMIFLTCICLLLTACAPAPPPDEPLPAPEPLQEEQKAPSVPLETFVPVFQLEAMPELPPYAAPGEIASRYYDEPWVDELRPAEDYGMLYPYAGYFRAYDIFYEYRYGLVDEHGRIVVDPVYNSVSYLTDEQGQPAYVLVYLARSLNEPIDNDPDAIPAPPPYRVYDMQGNLLDEGEGYAEHGQTYRAEEYNPLWASYNNDYSVDQSGLIGVKEVGDGWLAAYYWEAGQMKLVLLRGEQKYHFDNPVIPYLDCLYARGDKLLLYYSPTATEQGYCEVFDAAKGEVIQRIENRRLWRVLNERLLVFNTPDSFHYYQVLDQDFQPAFNEREFGGGLTNIEHVANNVYSVSTSLFSGLIRENGEWLIRVYINTQD